MSKQSREASRRHRKGRRLRDKQQEREQHRPEFRGWQFRESRAQYQDLSSGFSALDRKFMRPEFGY